MQVRPIVAALRSHKAAVTLLVLEIALTMAVLANLFFIVRGTMERAHTPTGIAESQIGVIQSIGVIGKNVKESTGANLAALQAVPGVQSAAFGAPPLWNAGRVPVFRIAARQHKTLAAYNSLGSQGLSQTLGLHIVAGHDFVDSHLPTIMQIFGAGKGHPTIPALVTRSLAHKLYGDADPLGKMFYTGSLNLRVIGVIDHLRGNITGRATDDDSFVVEGLVGSQDFGGGYMIRVKDSARLPQVLRAAAAALQKASPGHVQAKMFTFSDYRADYFSSALATSHMLVAIMLILLIVTALGVGGLASFWVQQRRRHIGMRRALGATRGNILRYFQIENLLIVTAGIVLGAIVAYVLNLALMQHFELPRLPPDYLVTGAVALWILGQLAVLGPAMRASHVSPVVATRAV
ncbi:MAG TPA: FtsX-like permease family protein [Rhodanobacteraceae bacterium]